MHIPGYSEVEWLDLGAQADIYRARNANGEVVALKLVRADRLVDEHDVMQRLEREARLLQQIQSDHVVRIRAFVQHPTGAWCLIEMDYLDGEPLQRVMNRLAGRVAPRVTRDSPTVKVSTDELDITVNPAPSREAPETRPKREVSANLQTADHVGWALARMIGICRGVAELHKRRLVHRDLKPHNVMLVGDREVLIDFGLARSPDMTMMTKTGTAVGTVAYMSPQQLEGVVATESDDAYGLGSTFVHLLTGWPAVDDSVKSLTKAANRRRPPDVRHKNRAVPKALADIVARCLEPDRRDRYGNACELLGALTAYRDGKPLPIKWTAGRFWRHHCIRLLVAAAILALGLLIAFVWPGFNADATASEVMVKAERDTGAARAQMAGLPDHERGAVLMAINRRVSADGAESARIAAALDFGMLKFDAHRGYRLAIFSATEGATPGAVCFHEFVSADRPRHLVAPKGLAWVLIGSTDPTQWWSSDDPRILQTLQKMETADAATSRSLKRLPLDQSIPASFADMAESPSSNANSPTVRVGRWEVDGGKADYYREWLNDRFRFNDVDQRLLRHPDEPEQATKMLEMLCKQRTTLPKDKPAMVTFWEAHRIAVFFGCRLPSVNEWFTVASEVKLTILTEETRVPDVKDIAPVMASPRKDRTQSGVDFANTNVTEWTFDAGAAGTSGFRAMPPITKYQGEAHFVPRRPMGAMGAQHAGEPTGLRLYRTRFHP